MKGGDDAVIDAFGDVLDRRPGVANLFFCTETITIRDRLFELVHKVHNVLKQLTICFKQT